MKLLIKMSPTYLLRSNHGDLTLVPKENSGDSALLQSQDFSSNSKRRKCSALELKKKKKHKQ